MTDHSHLKLDNILQSMGDAFVSLDYDWRYNYINDKALVLMGKAKEELLGKTIWECFPDIKGSIFDREYHKVMDKRVDATFETYYPSYDMWMEVRAYPHDGGISIFYTDISERKKTEQDIFDIGQRFQLFARMNPAGVFHTDDKGKSLFVNERWLEITGVNRNEIMDGSWGDVVHEDDAEEDKKYWAETFAARGEINREYRFRNKKTGAVMDIWTQARPILTAEGNLKGYVGTIEDITQRKQARRTIEEINKDLEERVRERTLELTIMLEREKELNDLKSRFVSIASHEFRTPLSTILSSVELIDSYRDNGETEKQQKHITRIKNSVENLINTLGVFLSLEKLEQGKVKLETKEFDLKDFITKLTEELEDILKPGQQIVYHHAGDCMIYTDQRIVRNIMLNLLSNASKYSENEITVNSSIIGNDIRISISDTGIGIPEEEQKYLFSKFFRAGNVGSVQGTGLGLSIVQRYVELLKGNITFVSEYKKGTTFTLAIPADVLRD